MYYFSKMLVDVETQYLPLEKMVLALVHATRQLPHYLLPSPYGLDADQISLAITLEEIRFH